MHQLWPCKSCPHHIQKPFILGTSQAPCKGKEERNAAFVSSISLKAPLPVYETQTHLHTHQHTNPTIPLVYSLANRTHTNMADTTRTELAAWACLNNSPLTLQENVIVSMYVSVCQETKEGGRGDVIERERKKVKKASQVALKRSAMVETHPG